jgi:uncharacterized protein YjbJ (UPF0337 family)
MKTDTVKGKVQELAGKVEKKVGGALGDPAMQRRGAGKELAGQIKQDEVKAKERAHGAVEQALGTVDETVGAVVGDEVVEARGRKRGSAGAALRESNP